LRNLLGFLGGVVAAYLVAQQTMGRVQAGADANGSND
jgi:hypothetical protein